MLLEDLEFADGADGRAVVSGADARTPRQPFLMAVLGTGLASTGWIGVNFLPKVLGKFVTMTKIGFDDDAPCSQIPRQASG
jgi:hypothetical protein